MPRYRMWFIGLAVLVSGLALRTASADTWRLDADQKWKEVSAERRGRFLVALANADRFVNTGQVEQAQASFDAIKKDFPEIAGPDIDLFIEAEMHYCKGKLAKTIRSHDKLLSEYPRSSFRDAALGLIKMKRYGEGIAIMEKITDRTGFDTVMGIDAATAVARSYEERRKFNEAYLKWWEISLHWQRGPVGRDAIMGMARTKLAVYNSHPEHRRELYDASSLETAKSNYERLGLLYPGDAAEIGAYKIIRDIDEQLANKQLAVGRYYQKVGNTQAANLYYDMIVRDWKDSKAAESARKMLAENRALTNDPPTAPEK
ncbi:MAG: outer membrane protein assembly factor BamD [Planctomycetota bacterium]|jgi:outer membrane protein assembly factor BamD (BamD/ComL family)